MGGTIRKSSTPRPGSEESDGIAAPEPAGTPADKKPAETPAHAETPDTEKKSAADQTEPADPTPQRPGRADRAGLLAAAAAVAACGGLVLYGVLDTDDSGSKPERRIPTASVTYEVTGQGTADITYQARNETGKATVVSQATLPWRTTVDVPLGKDPIINITLDEKGGQARCAVAIRGKHVQSATATGTFGRATCSGVLPRPDTTEG
ncbi:hypothetical protein [Streptomyces sp. 2A115]|uniref:hypothetical protein n=1 Tax=Streptomyces sp. 2A115 TaxID=3457439 RepID=UPI003FD31571